MIESVAVQGIFKLVLAVIAVIVSRVCLLQMDRGLMKTSTPFSRWLAGASDMSKGVYYGARIIAVMLLVGMVIG